MRNDDGVNSALIYLSAFNASLQFVNLPVFRRQKKGSCPEIFTHTRRTVSIRIHPRPSLLILDKLPKCRTKPNSFHHNQKTKIINEPHNCIVIYAAVESVKCSQCSVLVKDFKHPNVTNANLRSNQWTPRHLWPKIWSITIN